MAPELYKREHCDLKAVTLDKISADIDCRILRDFINGTSIKSATSFRNAQREKQAVALTFKLRRAKYLYPERHFEQCGLRISQNSIMLLWMQLKKQKNLNTIWIFQHGLQSCMMYAIKFFTQKTWQWSQVEHRKLFEYFATTPSPIRAVLSD